MVFDAYSDFVNNHSLAMETVKSLARQKQAFADFLKVRVRKHRLKKLISETNTKQTNTCTRFAFNILLHLFFVLCLP